MATKNEWSGILAGLATGVGTPALIALGSWAAGILTNGWVVEQLGGARRTEVTALESRVDALENREKAKWTGPYSYCQPRSDGTCLATSPTITLAGTAGTISIDWCAKQLESICGQATADLFCKHLGYGKATEFAEYNGPIIMTYRLDERKTLKAGVDFPVLKGFSAIVCGK